MEDVRSWWAVIALIAERRDSGSIGGRVDENLVDILRFEVSVVTETHAKRTCKSVNEEIKELVFVNFTVCWLIFVGHTSASRPLNLQPL
jgi:hypothetical protein